jgi:3',5'-cyclic-AMP phosphodiesterase
MRIAQITDLHVAEPGTFMRSFVDANEKLAAAVAFCNARADRLDAVLITGDLTNDGTPEQYRLLRELLEPLRVPYYAVPGNHDEGAPFRAAFADQPWLPATGPVDYVVDAHEVRLIGLDTTEPDRHDGVFHAAQAEWLDATLAARPEVPTVLFCHHPPFLTKLWLFDAIRLTGAELLRDVVARHPQVRQIVSGHVHRPVSSAWGTTALTCSPSTTHQSRCDLDPDDGAGIVDESPMLQVHLVDATSVITHSMPFEPAARTIEIGALVQDWAAARDRIVAGPPFPKGPGGMF